MPEKPDSLLGHSEQTKIIVDRVGYERMKRDYRDMFNAVQTVFVRCECGRLRESGIRCPTNLEGNRCDAGA